MNVDISKEELNQVTQLALNGRQLKTPVKQSQLLARRENSDVLRVSHLQRAISLIPNKLRAESQGRRFELQTVEILGESII